MTAIKPNLYPGTLRAVEGVLKKPVFGITPQIEKLGWKTLHIGMDGSYLYHEVANRRLMRQGEVVLWNENDAHTRANDFIDFLQTVHTAEPAVAQYLNDTALLPKSMRWSRSERLYDAEYKITYFRVYYHLYLQLALIFIVICSCGKPQIKPQHDYYISPQSAIDTCGCYVHKSLLSNSTVTIPEGDGSVGEREEKIYDTWSVEQKIPIENRIKNFNARNVTTPPKGEILASYRNAFMYLIDVNKKRPLIEDEIRNYVGLAQKNFRYDCNSFSLDFVFDTLGYQIENNIITKAPFSCFIGKEVRFIKYDKDIQLRGKGMEDDRAIYVKIPILSNETYIIKDAEIVRLYKKREKGKKK